jgi:hypothetical protein
MVPLGEPPRPENERAEMIMSSDESAVNGGESSNGDRRTPGGIVASLDVNRHH